MRRGATFMLLAGVLQGMPVAAAPCVGAAYDQPLPGAVDVVMRYADVPASQFPGIWQEGLIEGSFYQIFSNRMAVLRADRLALDWSITVECQQRPCLKTVIGNPPDAAKAAAAQLEQCLVPPEVKVAVAPSKPKPEKAKPKPQTSAIEAPDEAKPKDPVKAAAPVPGKPKITAPASQPAVAAPVTVVAPLTTAKSDQGANGARASGVTAAIPATHGLPATAGTGQQSGANTGANTGASTGVSTGVSIGPATDVVCPPVPQQDIVLRPLTCGLTLVPPGTPEATLQRLLVLAGANPGRIDGVYGRRTQTAVVQVLGFAGRNLDLQQSITAVDAYLCRQGWPQP